MQFLKPVALQQSLALFKFHKWVFSHFELSSICSQYLFCGNGKMTSTQNIWGKFYEHLENNLSSQYFLKILVSKKGILNIVKNVDLFINKFAYFSIAKIYHRYK